MIKLVACDLDRTLIPNGHEPDKDSLSLFSQFIKARKFTLAYVSGRNLKLFEEARSVYSIPLPDYFVGDVGTVLYKKEGAVVITDDSWSAYIGENTPNWDWEKIAEITKNPSARMQEKWKQNTFKLSYYIDDISKSEYVLQTMNKALVRAGVNADVVYSVDPLKNVGLVDILPSIATKVTAVEFLRKRLGLEKDEVVYCGDSGNDILPLTFGYKSIIVANASNEIKDEVTKINSQRGFSDNLYIAKGNHKYNGNYASGVLEGLEYFGLS